jgi:ABC-type glycerol-3-phosphate transport system permease component
VGGRALPEQYAYIMAISFLMTIPMIVIFFLAQRNYLKGMALAGIRK